MKNRKLMTVFAVMALVVTALAAYFVPEVLGMGAGAVGAVKAMAFITAGSEYNGKENMDIVIRPKFFGTKPAEMGIRIIDSQGASSVKLNFFGRMLKVLMPYVSGWQGGAASTKLQKKLTLAEFKAEQSYDKHDYANMIFEQITNKGGIAQNDITGTDVFNAEVSIFLDAVQGDVFANFWLGDTTKTHIADGTYPDGTAYAAGDADKYYNSINGILKKITTDAYQNYVSRQGLISGWSKSTLPTLYLAESSGTVYAYESAAKRTGASSGDRLFSFAATNATYPAVKALTELNSSGFGGSIQLLKACTSRTFELKANEADYVKNLTLPTLTTDTAATYFNLLFRLASNELKALKKEGMLRFYVSDSVLFNYEDTLKSGTLESARQITVDGVQRWAYNGIPIIPMGVDQLIEADFPSTFAANWIVLTTPDNLCMVINGSGNFAETRFWFNPDANENRQRTQFEMGADYILPELIAYAAG